MFDVRETSLLRASEQVKLGQQGKCVQISTIVPDWIGKIATHCIDKDFVLVELEDDIRKPPVSFALQAFSVTGGLASRRSCVKRPLDDIGDLHTGRKG